MRKKFALLLTFVLALAVALGVLAGCDKKEEVTVEISKTTLTVEVGKSSRLTASASDGSEIIWSTSDANIASVNDKGNVTGESAGTATITATVKDGTASASCEVTVTNPVTFVFKVDGTEVTEVEVDRNEGSVQLTATASDGSNIINWLSSDDDIVTVENGLLTGIGEGDAKITVSTATGSGEINVTVTDSIEGEHYRLSDSEVLGRWYYNIRTDGGRDTVFKQAEYREEKLIFDVSGEWNWSKDSLFLALKNPDLEDMGKWHKLTMNINSSIATSITIHDTVVDLKAGDNNNVTVCYQQWEYASVMIYLTNGDNEIRLVISNLNWDDTFEPVDLKTPSFTLSGSAIAITDNDNTEGVKEYEIGLFANGETEPKVTQTISGKSGTIDTSTVEGKNGTYNVRIKAIGVTGYNDSDWTAVNEYTYTINNADITYKLTTGTDPQKKGGGGKAAMTSGRWEYLITDIQEGVVYEDAYYENGAVTFKGTNGWAADTVQLARHFSEYAVGTELTVTMTLKASATGKIRVCGQVVSLVENEAYTVTVDVTQTSSDPTVLILLGVVAEDDSSWPGKLLASDSMQYGPITFTVSDVTVAPKA